MFSLAINDYHDEDGDMNKSEGEQDDSNDLQEDGDDIYIVEAIRKHRIVGKKREYFIKWENYPEIENTWEPIENLANVKHLVKEYEESLNFSK